jgi:hypothetical protein
MFCFLLIRVFLKLSMIYNHDNYHEVELVNKIHHSKSELYGSFTVLESLTRTDYHRKCKQAKVSCLWDRNSRSNTVGMIAHTQSRKLLLSCYLYYIHWLRSKSTYLTPLFVIAISLLIFMLPLVKRVWCLGSCNHLWCSMLWMLELPFFTISFRLFVHNDPLPHDLP